MPAAKKESGAAAVLAAAPLSMVRPAGFEPATYGFVVRCSIQLSQGRANIPASRPRQPGAWSIPRIRGPPRTTFGGEAGIRTRVPSSQETRFRRVPSASSATSPHPSSPAGRHPGGLFSSSQRGSDAAPLPRAALLAEGVGFEPTVPFITGQRFSRPPPSASRPSLPVQRAAEKGPSAALPLLPAPCGGHQHASLAGSSGALHMDPFERSPYIRQLHKKMIIRQETFHATVRGP